MNFRERIEQSRERQGNFSLSGNGELDRGYDCEYFATDNIRSQPPCIDLRLPDGKREFLPYALIVGISYIPTDGIKIHTTTKNITITGRNMEKLIDYLGAYRVRFIRANTGTDANENGLFVEKIMIEDLE